MPDKFYLIRQSDGMTICRGRVKRQDHIINMFKYVDTRIDLSSIHVQDKILILPSQYVF
jgi:hypothetical protein